VEPAIADDTVRGGVGADVRTLRKSRGLTIADLADAIGRSVGWLSQVERGQSEPSIRDLRVIARHFGIPIGFFFRNADAPAGERGLVVRAANRVTLGTRESGLTEELLSPDLSGDFEMFRSEFAPGASSGEMTARASEDGGYVVSGMLDLTIGERTYRLGPGDSFQFTASQYRWRNPGDVPAVVIWIVAPPVY
jgi:transcriptional regulator with XRE-family HTH domain